jgi:hypothetical protein
MRKDEHLKIVKELEDKIQELEKEIFELREKNTKSEFESKLNRFIADQRRDALNEVLSKNVSNTNYMIKYDKEAKKFFKDSMQRIQLDDEKFNALRDYIKKTFPQAIIEIKPEDMPKNSDNDNLSQTFIGEHGEVYKPYHVVDLAILIMNTQKQKLKEILGGEDDFNVDNNED